MKKCRKLFQNKEQKISVIFIFEFCYSQLKRSRYEINNSVNRGKKKGKTGTKGTTINNSSFVCSSNHLLLPNRSHKARKRRMEILYHPFVFK